MRNKSYVSPETFVSQILILVTMKVNKFEMKNVHVIQEILKNGYGRNVSDIFTLVACTKIYKNGKKTLKIFQEFSMKSRRKMFVSNILFLLLFLQIFQQCLDVNLASFFIKDRKKSRKV